MLFLEPSPFHADGGNLIGKLPEDLTTEEYLALNPPDTATKAIRAKCIDCCGGSLAEARKCVQYNCPLWTRRMGRGGETVKRKHRARSGQNLVA